MTAGKTGKAPGKKTIILISAAAAVLVLGGVFFALSRGAARTLAANAASTQTVALKKTKVEKSISVSGVVKSGASENIYSTLSQPVKEIYVEAGDAVETGDLLAQLDVYGLENDIAQAKVNQTNAANVAAEENRARENTIADAQNKLDSARLSLERQQLALSKAEQDFADAEKDAAAPYDSYKNDQLIDDAKTALSRKSADYDEAFAQLAQTLIGFDDRVYQNKITDAVTAFGRRQTELAQAEQDYSDAAGAEYPSEKERDAAVAAAKKKVDAAKTALNDARQTQERARADLTRAKTEAVNAENDQLDAAKKAKDDAQRAYDKALEDKAKAEQDAQDSAAKKLAAAKNTLADSKKQLELARNSLESAQNALRQAKAKPKNQGSSEQLQALNLEKLQEQWRRGQILATADGIVTEVNCKVGATPTGISFVIEDADSLYVSAKVKEYDLASLRLEQGATVTTEATGSEKFSAALTYISPKAVSEAGSTSVEFEIQAKLAQLDKAVKIGMNAFINMVTETAEDVYSVPLSAVVTNEKGSFVYAAQAAPAKGRLAKGAAQPTEIPVTLGLQTSAAVVISGDGLRDGMEILTDPEQKLSQGGQSRGMFPMGGRG
ncbi:MAG: efflux RND transporter periplasmic adaptor subunit [Oscillospiraceae bacterium]|jgi:multidrug efflux pump subunit AcrA (membrane-fusion protein)|nr:efflux RND transporter periplasmic adaptor subunit [Oscillospiraceae bacterium]